MRRYTRTRVVILAACWPLFIACSDDTAESMDDSSRPADGGAAGGGAACTVKAPTRCDKPDLRYDDIQPIIQQRCLSCHDGRGEYWPLTSYKHVTDWFDQIRGMMITCSMPPPASGLTMPVEERETILHWIRCGYPE